MAITATLNLLTSFARTLTAGGMLLALGHATAGQWVVASMIVSAVAAIAAVTMVTINFAMAANRTSIVFEAWGSRRRVCPCRVDGSAYNDLDKAMLSHFGMSAANGIYTMAYRAIDLATMPAVSMEYFLSRACFNLGQQA